MSTGALRSWRGVGVSAAPSQEGSRERESGEMLPWLERSVCFGEGGVYTFREGMDAMEIGDCGGNGCCGGAAGCVVTPSPSLISESTDLFTSSVICAMRSGSTFPAESDLSKALLRALWSGCCEGCEYPSFVGLDDGCGSRKFDSC